MSKIANVYIAYDLDAWPRNHSNSKLKNCLFEAIYVLKNSDIEKYAYSGYGITFDSVGSWSFGNDFDRNVVIFYVDNSLSSHADDCKKSFSARWRSTYAINESFGSPEKKFNISFSKANTKFCLNLHYNADKS